MLEKVPSAVGHALEKVRAGLDKVMSEDSGLRGAGLLQVSSPEFADGGALPARCTEDGDGASPAIAWSGAPDGAVSVVLVVEDADSPTPEPIVHCLAWGLPPSGELPVGALSPGAAQAPGLGKNSFMKTGWLPPDPPTGHGPHRYVFQVFALSARPDLQEGAGKGEVRDAIAGAVLASGRVIGTYERR